MAKAVRDDIAIFESLLRADRILFEAARTLAAQGQTVHADEINAVRRELAERLEVLQAGAYAHYDSAPAQIRH